MISSKGTIWFVNKDAAPIKEYATHLRTIKQAQHFQELGYQVKVICSSIVYNSAIDHLDGCEKFYKEECHDGVPFVFVKSLNYGESTMRRAISYTLFSFKLRRLARSIGKPNVVIHTSRIPFDALVYCFAKRCKARYILDITDLWPMEFEHFGFLSKKSPILKIFYCIERRLYRKADHVVISMEGGHQYIKDHKWDLDSGGKVDLGKVHYVNNGTDLDEFYANLNKYTLQDSDLEDNSTQKVIYLGSIRLANNLDQLINAAKILLPHKNIKVLIYGDGPERATLEDKCRAEGIDNVVFKQKWIEPQYVPFVLSRASVNILNYAKDWAPYGGSMNKMMLSFAAGRPIVCNAGMRFSPIRDNELGVDYAFNDALEYAEAILKMVNLTDCEKLELEKRSKLVAQEFHTPNLNRKLQSLCNL